MKLTPQEFDAVRTFRYRLKDLNLDADRNSSMYLIRWLRAREMNISLAEEMLRSSLDWRARENVDDVLNWCPPDDLLNFVNIERSGCDKEGVPVFILTIDMNYFDTILRQDRALLKKFITYQFENMERIVKIPTINSKPTKQVVGIGDLSGISIRKLINRPTYIVFRDFINIANRNYPEIQKQLYVINAPRLFQFCFGLIKHLIPPRTIEKLKIYGWNKNEWVKELRNEIPADQLSPKYGGTKIVTSA